MLVEGHFANNEKQMTVNMKQREIQDITANK
jgi:hypothetical protein